MGVFRVVVKTFVVGVEIAFRRVLVGEDFHHLLSFYHLFDESFFRRERALLRDHEFAALSPHFLDHEEHGEGAKEEYARHDETVREHHGHGHEKGEPARKQGRNALPHELANGVGVVGVRGHDFAVRVRVEVFDGQRLHFLEHVLTETVQQKKVL